MTPEQKFVAKKLRVMFSLVREFQPMIRKLAEEKKPGYGWSIDYIEYDEDQAYITYSKHVCGDWETEHETITIDEIINYMEKQDDVSA